MKEQINLAIKEDRLKPNEGMRLLAEYERGVGGEFRKRLNS